MFNEPNTAFFPNGLFPSGNVQVTSGTARQARSESVIAVNPTNPRNLIAASKKFNNPATYHFTSDVRVSFHVVSNWQDASLPTLAEWGLMVSVGGSDPYAGMTDPAVVFDNFGNAFLMGEPIKWRSSELGQPPSNEIDTTGMYVYKSSDGGQNWSIPTPLHVGDLSDDKSWIACDNNPSSRFYGRVYAAWGASSPLRFARSTDHGSNWTGVGSEAPGSKLADLTFAPEISVGLDGTIHIVWHQDGEGAGGGAGTTIEYVRSTDGGESFQAQKKAVTGVVSLRGNLPEVGGWPHFPDATFRVITIATGCAFGLDPLDKHFIVAWSDYREGAARIYYRISSDAGASFDGPDSGQALLEGQFVGQKLHHFHPQIIATGSGAIGCAYYEYGPKRGGNLIDVMLSASFDQGISFFDTTRVTDRPWDPAIDAPFSHGDSRVTFIGEYFGLDADQTGFDVLWTDTRTGVQELFFDRVDTQRPNNNIPIEVAG